MTDPRIGKSADEPDMSRDEAAAVVENDRALQDAGGNDEEDPSTPTPNNESSRDQN